MGNVKIGGLRNLLRGRFSRENWKNARALFDSMGRCTLRSDLEDPTLSTKGEAQVKDIAIQMASERFVEREGIELIVHSDLLRTQRTCAGIFGQCSIPTEESSLFREWTPGERDFTNRVRRIRQWLSARPESKIIIVGHGMLFQALTSTDHFDNVEVRKYDFDVSSAEIIPSSEERVYRPRKAPNHSESCPK